MNVDVLAYELGASTLAVTNWFPNLTNDIKIVGARGGHKNCHGHALCKNEWVDAGMYRFYHEFLLNMGFRPTNDKGYKEGTHKIAVYCKKHSLWVDHTAKRTKSGWVSKLGSGPIVFHKELHTFAGGIYGEVKRIYVME